MSDILSTFYKSNYTLKENTYCKKRNFYTPNKITKINPDQTFKNLSPYGFYLSENNFILLSKQKLLPTLSIYNTRNPLPNTESLTQSKDLSSIMKNKKDKNQINLKNDNDKDNLMNKEGNKTDYNNKNKRIQKYKDILKIKDEFISFNSKKEKTIKVTSPKNGNNISKPFKNKIRKNKYLCYTEDPKEKIENSKKAEQITNELLSLTKSKDIRNYYFKKDNETIKKNETDKDDDKPVLDPMIYIKYNLVTNPQKKDLFKSFDVQLMIMGNEKYRNNLLDGVNDYKYNVAKYEDLKGPTGFDKNRVEEKKRNNIIKKMNRNFIEKRGMVFTYQTFKPKSKPKKKMFAFEYDEEYKSVKKLMNNDIEKYEKKVIKKFSKNNMLPVDKKDLNIMNKLDSEANYLIKGADDMVKFSNRFLSFDEKLNKLVSKTINTTGYLFKRTKEYHKIKTKIDQFYNIDENKI